MLRRPVRGLKAGQNLLVLLLVFGLLATAYSLSTPLFEAPDEPWHYAYVRWLAEGHGLPRLDDDASGAGQEVAQPPLYYAVAALLNSLVSDDDLPELFWHNPQFGYQAGGTVNDNKNMLIHTDRERFPWRGAVLAVRLARLVSLIFGLLAVGATYGLAREALLASTWEPSRATLAMLAAAVAALTPQFLFISGVVNNDSATAATCTAALWALARIIRRGPTPRRAAVAGLALGLALLSKTSTLLLLPMALLALELGRRAVRQGSRQANASRQRPQLITDAALMLGLAGAVGGWWYLRNWILYDDPLGLSVHVNTLWGRPAPVSLTALLPELPMVFRSFWGAFGWGHVEWPGYLYVALGGLVVLAMIGWARRLLQFRREKPAQGSLAVVGIYLLAGVWCLAVLGALLRWMQQVEAPHGRLLFPALGAWGLLLAVGWTALAPGQTSRYARICRYLPLVPLSALFLLALITPWAIIRPAFALPRLLAPPDAAKNMRPQELVYGDQARLLGYRVEPESVVAGEGVKVTLCWEALRPMEQDYTLFIHLLGRENSRVAERTSYPGQGRFPTSLWPVGRAFCESYRMEVAPWAVAPELYALEVGLHDAETGWRLPAQNAAGQPVEPPTVGLVRITPTTPSPAPAHTLSYNLGDQIALVGYDASTTLGTGASTTLAASDTLTLTLYWQALQTPQGDYKVFVHLLDASGEQVTQDDAFPRNGHYPTWAWRPGDLVPDSHQLTLPDERPPGPYYVLVGMYHPDTGERLPVTGPQGLLPHQAIPLGEIGD